MNNTLLSYSDYDSLIRIINYCYKLNIKQIYLHRDMIGYVYIAKCNANKYVLKLYRHFNTAQALQSIDIIKYLKQKEYPVVSIVSTDYGSSYITLSTPYGQCVAILYDYIEGIEPNFKIEIEGIARQIGQLHTIMDEYPKLLINRGKEFYIDRFISMLKELQYSNEKIQDLEQYGLEIWSAIEKLPRGFCHGDLHSGNMFKIEAGIYVLYDFDIASNAHAIIDIAALCNVTDFNNLDESSYDNTMVMIERFYQEYNKEKNVSNTELTAIYNFIAARHYELIATITECEGLLSLDRAFLDEQYEWLMAWRNICSRKPVHLTDLEG